jgi:hypothetical protein
MAGEERSGVACRSHTNTAALLLLLCGSAEQSALMLREVPRVHAHASETGDWSLVDVYLSKRPGLGLLILRGSAWEGEVMEWVTARSCPVVTVGGALPGAALDVTIPCADDAVVRTLAEVRVAELLAAELYSRHGGTLYP